MGLVAEMTFEKLNGNIRNDNIKISTPLEDI